MHKPPIRQFTRNHLYKAGIDTQWQAELADMQCIVRQNGKVRYLFAVINIFFKFAKAILIQTKHAKTNTEAFGQVLTVRIARHFTGPIDR